MPSRPNINRLLLLEDPTDRPVVRYKIDDVWAARTRRDNIARTRRDNIWFTNKQGSIMAILNFEYEGEDTKSSPKFGVNSNYCL